MMLPDVEVATEFFHAMLEAMADFGGHPLQVLSVVTKWCRDHIQSKLGESNHLFLVAETLSPTPKLTGFLEAGVAELHPVFSPKLSLHISAIYIEHNHRRARVARSLMETALDWGRERGCVKADLHVLQHSSAKSLCESLGFAPFELEMRRAIEEN